MGVAEIDIYLNHVYEGGGKITEKEESVYLPDCRQTGGLQAEVELFFRQTKGFALRNIVFL